MQISLITPVYNNAETIAECIRSIRSQTVECQHIIVDGCSTDGTLEILERKRTGNTLVVSEPDQGMYDAINKGIELAVGEVVGILNSDDFYAHTKVLEIVAETFMEPGIDACYGDLVYVNRQNTDRVIRSWKSGAYKQSAFYNGWMPPHPTFFIRKTMYEQHGGYRLDIGTAADYELMLRMLLKHGVRPAYIPEVLVIMRNAGISNASLKNRINANRNDRKAWRVNSLRPRIWTLAAKPLRKLTQWV